MEDSNKFVFLCLDIKYINRDFVNTKGIVLRGFFNFFWERIFSNFIEKVEEYREN